MSSPPLKLLLSAFALRTWGPRIQAVAPAGTLAFVTAEDALAVPTDCDADFAFMTREVTGKSSSNNPTSELQGFDAVVRKAPKLKWLQIHPAGAERPIYRELRGRGVEFTDPVADHGYGLVTYFKAPGGLRLQLYQPRYVKKAKSEV